MRPTPFFNIVTISHSLAWEWDVCPKSNFQNSDVILIDAMKEDHACRHSLFPKLQIVPLSVHAAQALLQEMLSPIEV